jgi:5'-nucleotidase (lipoprotein e(P4) family)
MKKASFFATFFTVVILLVSSCSTKSTDSFTGAQDHLIMSVLWFQKSAEMQALFIQGYNIASEKLRDAVAQNSGTKPLAVVADIDETILDNSPFEGWQIATGKGFTDETWKEWTDRGEAKPLPGALGFAKLAESLGVEIFYVSNRSEGDALETTIQNLKELGFPYADREHMLLKTETSSKVERRGRILETHEIVMLIGDNLADLDAVFEERDASLGFDVVDSLSHLFGERFIVLPNPMYGSWVNPSLGKEDLPERERYVRSIISY